MNKQLKADLMLVLVTLCWGISYYLMDLALTDMDPFTLNAHRFLGAFAVAGLLSYKKVKDVNRITLKYSLLVGAALVFVYIGATFGVKYTTLSNSGFLCALTVVFTPLIAWVFLRQKLDRKMTLSVVMCFIGIALLTLKDDFSINLGNLKGDLLCIICAVAYAIDLLLTEKAVSHKEVDAYQLGVFQLGVTGLCNLILAIIVETPHFPTTGNVWGAVIFLSIFCTGVAFVVQPVAQQYTSASHVGVIFALEPVFAGIVAFALAGEVLSPKSYFGAVLMIASIFIMEIDFSRFFSRKKKQE
ncbi:MAG: DMT family transporter [Anaerovoracaceae bacterium]|nr:DMT family transporter [Anaerovoracaceae bacterium]